MLGGHRIHAEKHSLKQLDITLLTLCYALDLIKDFWKMFLNNRNAR